MSGPGEGPGLLRGAVDTIGMVPVKIVETLVPSETVRNGIEENRSAVYGVVGAGVLLGTGAYYLG